MSDSGLEWVDTTLAAWGLWCAAGGVSVSSGNLYENWGVPPSTASDPNGKAHDDAMLDVDAAVLKLPRLLYLPVHCYYRRDMGRRGSALACKLSVRTFDNRLKLAHYHVARLLQSSTDRVCG